MRRDASGIDAKEMLEWCATVCDEFVEKFVDEAEDKVGDERARTFGKADGALLIAEALRTFGGVKLLNAEGSMTAQPQTTNTNPS